MMPLNQFAQTVVEQHQHYTAAWKTNPQAEHPNTELLRLVIEQHQKNFDLWHEEDKAREPGAADATIAQVKRNIDALNQRRNDLVTEIDIWLAEHELANFHDDTLPWNSETIGSIIDRLSIASLKVYHMAEQTQRNDASAEHIQNCEEKLAKLKIQRTDLAHSLQVFIDDIIAGRKQNKLYRQFKMYNDPSLNPKIYGKK